MQAHGVAHGVQPASSPEARGPAPLPLAGVRVIDLTRAWAGPFCATFLAELGAEVIKVEPPEGDSNRGRFDRVGVSAPGARAYNLGVMFNHINRYKRAVALDLRAPAGRELLLRLAAVSDCMVENFRPGVLDRLGLGFEALSSVRPQIVLGSISGYGHVGPFATYRAYGVAVEPMSGLFSVTGYPDGEPLRSGVDHPDPQTGLSLASAILVALLQARRTGKGRHVKTSLLRAMSACFAPHAIAYLMTGVAPTRRGNDSEAFCPHGVYRCAGDDQWITIAVTTEAEWHALCTTVGRSDLATDARLATADGRRHSREIVDTAITAWTSTLPKAAAERALQERGVPAAAVQSVADLVGDEHLAARKLFCTVEHPEAGASLHIAARFKTDGAARPVTPAPTFGEATDAVLQGLLGLSEAEVDRLCAQGVVLRTPRPAAQAASAQQESAATGESLSVSTAKSGGALRKEGGGRVEAAREINLVCMSGQGSVQTAEILGRAFYTQYGYHVASRVFPGNRSKSAPVISYLKVSPAPIPLASVNYVPDDVLVFWDGLLRVAAKRGHPIVTEAIGRQRSGNLIVNSTLRPDELVLPFKFQGTVATVDATGIAKKILKRDPPPVGITMAGAYVAVTQAVTLDIFLELVREHFPGRVGAQNAEAARLAYEQVVIAREVLSPSEDMVEDAPPVDAAALPVQTPLWKGSMRGFRDGSAYIWRTRIPISDDELCRCKDVCLSELMCPDNTGFIVRAGLPHQGYRVDVDHCRGCGICAEVCVYGALRMLDEVAVMRTNPTYEGISVEPFTAGAREGVRSGAS